MKTLEQVMQDIRSIEAQETKSDLADEIIIAFGDYEFDSEDEVVISGDSKVWQCYINHAESPIICVEVEENQIINVW